MAIVNVHFALLLVQGTKTKDGEKLRFLVELHSVTLSLLFIGEMNGKRWNKAQSFMEIEYLGFNAAFLVIVVHLSKNQRERYSILLLIIIISHQI